MSSYRRAPPLQRALVVGLALAILVALTLSCATRPSDRRASSEALSPTPEEALSREETQASRQRRTEAMDRIAYTSPDGELLSIKPDGTGSRRRDHAV